MYLLDRANEEQLANMKMEPQSWPEDPFDIGEIWNPVCCHGNKTLKLILWGTSNDLTAKRQTVLIQIG